MKKVENRSKKITPPSPSLTLSPSPAGRGLGVRGISGGVKEGCGRAEVRKGERREARKSGRAEAKAMVLRCKCGDIQPHIIQLRYALEDLKKGLREISEQVRLFSLVEEKIGWILNLISDDGGLMNNNTKKVNYPVAPRKEVLEKGYLPPVNNEKPGSPPRPPLKR